MTTPHDVVLFMPLGGNMLKQVGETQIQVKHRASCHCGAVELELSLPQGIVNPRRCDCSICRRKGAIVGSVNLDDIRIVKGEEFLKLYQFNTGTAKHYFCSNCGIYTHHQRRSNPQEYGFNIGCLEGVNPFDLGAVVTNDGVNHPADS
ncbi:glutathione-dependent formaldehyde-activating GFA [Shewanella woodyi ATCC 51908]|uniref:Glutathione-dependent formaldehyde-activating GFA n=2 Tax=Shewanella woodyi TaxID=60961 RepID=B1KLB4_SHEWM|nr:glutathione-dependent formaldehyde-activating GFA [Shewanella woodyi ATCC 51908]